MVGLYLSLYRTCIYFSHFKCESTWYYQKKSLIVVQINQTFLLKSRSSLPYISDHVRNCLLSGIIFLSSIHVRSFQRLFIERSDRFHFPPYLHFLIKKFIMFWKCCLHLEPDSLSLNILRLKDKCFKKYLTRYFKKLAIYTKFTQMIINNKPAKFEKKIISLQ
jgi:hypothetical protein